MTRVAAIDCGTNSIRLLIADVVDGQLRDAHREMRIVRLGQGVDATGAFAPEALQRTRSALVDYAGLCTTHSVDRIRMVATSATRDAGNRDVFFAMTAEVLGDVADGAVAEVITGTEEAELSFRGAVHELDTAAGPFVIVDLGGGSTEVVLGTDVVVASYSADIGCVRLTERCLHSDPPTAAEVAAAREVVRERLGEALRVVPVEQARTWVGVAGTMTTVAALAQDMITYDSFERRRGAAADGMRRADRHAASATRCVGAHARGPGRRDRWRRHRHRGTGDRAARACRHRHVDGQ
jgi:exopolyphosphatase/guanosine-5'-triphosphate,3'-diphosphate pyrophosphatase